MPTIADYMTNDEVMLLIGGRIKSRRLGKNIPVDQLADNVGLNRKTILELEAGRDVKLSSMIKILRGLNLLSSLEATFSEVLPAGEGISTRGQPRLRASTGKIKHGS